MPESILFIDDDPMVANFLSTFTGMLHLDCEIATDIATARAKFEKKTFRLVVTDLKMPDGDGLELAKMFREKDPTIGIFAFTGEFTRYPLSVLRETFDQIFLKPTDYSRMIAECLRYLASSQRSASSA